LNHIKNKLKLEDLEGVYDDVDGAPVVRIASLVDNGLYFARPTEVSPCGSSQPCKSGNCQNYFFAWSMVV